MLETSRWSQSSLNDFGKDFHLVGSKRRAARHPGEHGDNLDPGAFAGAAAVVGGAPDIGTAPRRDYLDRSNRARRALAQAIKAARDLKIPFNPAKAPDATA